MANPGYDSCIVEAELRARSAYAQPHRYYHDERHLDECLAALDGVPNLDDRTRRIVRWAILWHDSVYDPGHRDNEERSARLAISELAACGVADADVQEVARLVRLTEKHRVDPGDQLGALVVSIDFAILGSDRDRYREYCADVRREYAHVPEPLWRSGRALVLQRILTIDPLYPDPEFRERLERQARENIDAEIRELDEG